MRKKELTSQVRRDNLFHNTFIQKTHSFRKQILKHEGFLADPSKPLWQNKKDYLANLPIELLLSSPSNMAVHNLCLHPNKIYIPKGTISTFGLGLNFCIKSAHPTNNYKKSLNRFKRDIRIKHLFRDKPDNGNYLPGLYIPNSEWEPKKASKQIEDCLQKFESKLHQQQKQFQRCYTPPQHNPTTSKRTSTPPQQQ